MKSILDKSFRYTNSANTDVRKTIARARKALAEQQALNHHEADQKIATINPRRKHGA